MSIAVDELLKNAAFLHSFKLPEEFKQDVEVALRGVSLSWMPLHERQKVSEHEFAYVTVGWRTQERPLPKTVKVIFAPVAKNGMQDNSRYNEYCKILETNGFSIVPNVKELPNWHMAGVTFITLYYKEVDFNK